MKVVNVKLSTSIAASPGSSSKDVKVNVAVAAIPPPPTPPPPQGFPVSVCYLNLALNKHAFGMI
jgi:hypothetical protein